MEDQFESRFGLRPKWRIECPGRVNIIGEHIDYHGYSVLPMALSVKTTLLVAPISQSEIRFENVDDFFEGHTECLPSNWERQMKPLWFHYLLAGWKEIVHEFGLDQKGFAILMDSSIPSSAGLSSSSSLVCAAALASLTVHTHGFPWKIIDKVRLAELCMKAEHRIGTVGGGMDQAAECLSQSGSALHISFNPLRCESVSLPSHCIFVVADSMERKNKAASNDFNSRVVEGRISTALLAKGLGIEKWKDMKTLKDVQEESSFTLEKLIEKCNDLPEQLNVIQVRELIGDHFDAISTQDTVENSSFTIRARAIHVYSEALRVQLFKVACFSEDINEMARLMNDSHSSCSQSYECSTPQMDKLVSSLITEGGALGARLTGAGWGGCAVALFHSDYLAKGDFPSHLNILFHSKPAEGIAIVHL
uniref:Tag-96 n=1 Tax=Pristionchus pacificus TaxID=54126 RepID=A0A8R1YQE2_PRIPA